MRFVTGLVVWTTLVFLPLFTLLAVQIGFLPYHSDWTTLFHRVAVLGDVAALGFFWPQLAAAERGDPWDFWRAQVRAWPLGISAGLWWVILAGFAWECWTWFFAGEYLQYFEWSWDHGREQWEAFGPETRQAIIATGQYGLPLAPLALALLYRAWRWSKRRPWAWLPCAAPVALLMLGLAGVLVAGVIVWPEVLLQRLAAFYAELVFLVRWPPLVAGATARSWFGAVGRFPPFAWPGRLILWLRRRRDRGEAVPSVPLPAPAGETFAHPSLAGLLLAAYVTVLVAVLPDTELPQGPVLSHLLFDPEAVSVFHRSLRLGEKLLIANAPDLETLDRLNHASEKDSSALVKIAGLDLRSRDLRHADLEQARLYKADLRSAKIQRAGLEITRLQGAHLRGAQLQGADLGGAQLQGADLRGAQLQGADLRDAELSGAYLGGAQLQGAHLGGAQLQGAHLRHAQLQGASLHLARLGSTLFDHTDTGLNDLRGADFGTPFSQADYDAVSAAWAGKHAKRLAELKQRIGQAPLLPEPGFEPPCLSAANLPATGRCGRAEDYFPQLAEFLGTLACQAGDSGIPPRVLAGGIARRVVLPIVRGEWEDEWKGGGETARLALARRLLADDCAGKEGIDDRMREPLKKMAEPSQPAPSPNPNAPPAAPAKPAQ